MQTNLYRSLLVAIATIFLPTASYAQLHSDKRPQIELRLLEQSITATDGLDFEVVVSNPTKSDFDIRKILVYFPENLRHARRFQNTNNNVDIWNEDGAIDLNVSIENIKQGTFRVYRGTLPAYNRTAWQAVVDSGTLFFIPGKYNVRAEAMMNASGFPDQKDQPWATSSVHVTAPLSAPLRGGIIGSLLLALFFPAFSYLQQRKNQESTYKTHPIGQFFVYVLSGSVVSTTAILVIFRLGSADFPISLQINDWLGGVIVGLFSYPVGNKLYEMLFPDTEQQPP